MWLYFLLSVFVAVQCAPSFSLLGGGKSLPSLPSGETQPYGVHLAKDGVELNKHKERTSHTETHNRDNGSYASGDENDPDHKSKSERETSHTHDSTEDLKETEDSGMKLSLSGVHLYDNKHKVADRTSADTETLRTSDASMDRDGDRTHLEKSGRDFENSTRTKDHHESDERSNIDLNGDFTKHISLFSEANASDMFDNLGKGDKDALSGTGRGEGGSGSKETRSLDTHEREEHTNENVWSKTRDEDKDGNRTHISTTDQVSNHSTDLDETSKAQTQEKAVKVIKGDDERGIQTTK